MSIHIHKKVKICFICNKKIKAWIKYFNWDYWDYEITHSEELNGIKYYYVDKYWHAKCAWNIRPMIDNNNDDKG